MDIPPEVQSFSDRLKYRYGAAPLRHVNEEFYRRALEEALEFKGVFYTFFKWGDMKFFVAYRKDRSPNNDEVMPFLQTLFEDGTIQELLQTPFARHFVQGEQLYTTHSIAEQMGTALADYADRKDEVEQFDLEQTDTGRRLMRRQRNGH